MSTSKMNKLVPDILSILYIDPYRIMWYNSNMERGDNMAPASKAQQKAVAKYMKNNYDELKVRVPKGSKETIKAAADQQTKGSINGYVNQAINERLERDGFKSMQKQDNKEVS